MIENCISLVRRKKENNVREEVFRRYIADSIKVIIEAYYNAHESHVDMPVYKDFDSIVREYKQPSRTEDAEEIKDRLIKKLKKAERQ